MLLSVILFPAQL